LASVVAGSAILIVVLLAGPASAHVSVSPKTATAGGFATLTFQVPNEKDDASTTKVQVQFPTDTPMADASVQPVPGWTADVAKKKLTTPVTTDEGDTLDEGVASITWTANDGKGILAGQFQQFLVSVGLPDAESLTFPTIQTYSDGSTVNWAEQTVQGGPEPDHPAPVVTLTKGSEAASSPTSTTATASDNDSDSGKTIAIIGLIVGVVALIVAAFALVGRRRTPA
jgi:uncharacterized protein